MVAVVEHVNGLARQNLLRESKQGHVGPSKGAVDREEAQTGGWQTVQRRIGMRHQLVSLLGRRVERQGMIHVLMHREGHLGIGPVNRTGGSVDQMGHVMMPAALQDVGGADHVAVHVGQRVLQAVAHTRLGGQVDNPVKALLGEQRRYRVPLDEVQLDEAKARQGLKPLDARLLECDVVVAAHVVQPDHFVASLEQGAGRVKANKSGRAGD